MAEGLNRVLLLGNLGADPEYRVTSTGQQVLKMRLATSETYLDRNRVRQERTEWHSVVLWGKRAEALSKFLAKGARLFIEGGLRTSSYEDRDGNKRYRTDVVASNVILAGRGEGGGMREPRGGGEGPTRAEGRTPRGEDDFVGPPPEGSGYDDVDYGPGQDDDIPF